jgi:hypothetical protein
MQISKYAYYVQLTEPSKPVTGKFLVWKFVVKGANPQTHKPFGEWEARPWLCIVWRGVMPPPKAPPGTVMVWLYGPPNSTHAPVLGQQQWAPLDLAGAITTSVDVDAANPSDGDILVYNGTTNKWTAKSGSEWYKAMKAARP